MKLSMICIYVFLIFFVEAACAMEPIKSKDDNSRFYESIRKNDIVGIQRYYRDMRNDLPDDYEDPLVYSARVGAAPALKFILNNHYKGDAFYTIRSQAFLAASFSGSIQSMKSLVIAGVDKNYSRSGVITPIWASIEGGHLDVFTYLLSLGADYKVVNTKGENLLFPAVVSGNLKVIEILIGLGLNPKTIITSNSQERTLKDYAYYRWKDNPEHLEKIIKLIDVQQDK